MKEKESATVLSATRRNAKVLLSDFSIKKVKISNKFQDLCVGDMVLLQNDLIVKQLDRKNKFSRSLGHKTKDIAVNIDYLFLVVAVGALFQTKFIDRVLSVSKYNNIPVCLLVNKIDLGLDDCLKEIEHYKNINIPVIEISAKFNKNLDDLNNILFNPKINVVSFTGVSGVGKSTLLNHYIPKANRETKEVRTKSKMGQQTTTQSEGYLLKRDNLHPLILIDPPGVQNFGVTELDVSDLKETFIEFNEYASNCEYRSCMHVMEENCGVKLAVNEEKIAKFRYDSYLALKKEIEKFKPY